MIVTVAGPTVGDLGRWDEPAATDGINAMTRARVDVSVLRIPRSGLCRSPHARHVAAFFDVPNGPADDPFAEWETRRLRQQRVQALAPPAVARISNSSALNWPRGIRMVVKVSTSKASDA